MSHSDEKMRDALSDAWLESLKDGTQFRDKREQGLCNEFFIEGFCLGYRAALTSTGVAGEPEVVAYQGRSFDASYDNEGWSTWRNVEPQVVDFWRTRVKDKPGLLQMRALCVAVLPPVPKEP